MRPQDKEKEVDLFQKEYLELIYDIQMRLESRSISFQDKDYTVTDLCFKPINDKSCLITSPMEFWKMNITEMRNDKDIKQTAKCLKETVKEEMPCFDRIGTPIMIDSVFGKQGCENNEKSDSCTLCRKTAGALSK